MSKNHNGTIGTNRFEKNNYFYGKLLTVRDMAAEQAYHSGIQRTLSRYITDWGIVCGLDVDSSVVTDDETGHKSLDVTVSEGLALDRCGRLISVPDEHQDSISIHPTVEGVETDTVSVYVEYDECFTDPVPTTKMENACDEDCEDNRTVETATVTIEAGNPEDYHKSIADVEFPTTKEMDIDRDAVLSGPARSYYENEPRTACPPTSDDRILVGTITRDGEDWNTTSFTYGPVVYTNDLLYDVFVSHAADFDNPHDSVASVEGVVPHQGNIDLTSSDGSVTSSAGEGPGQVDLTVDGPSQGDLDALTEYVRDKTLKYTIRAFYDVAQTYADVDGDLADEINRLAVNVIKTARDALEERGFVDETEFATVMLGIGSDEHAIRERLRESREGENPLATDESFADYTAMVDALVALLPTTTEGEIATDLPDGYADMTNVTRLVVVQDQLAEAATWLERDLDRMILPGGHPVDRRIIGDLVPDASEAVGLEPGEIVVDRDDADPDLAVVLTYVTETASEWIVFGDETVDYQNPGYAADERVVLVSFVHLLDEAYEYWEAADPEDLFHGVMTRSIKFHAFPESRLVRYQE